MKVTDPEIIKDSEKELIDAITGDLDWDVIEKVFKKEHNLSLHDDVEYKQGDIVVHNNQIAYKLEFDVKVKLSVLFNRNGEYLSLSADSDQIETPQEEEGFEEIEAAESPAHVEEEEEGAEEIEAAESIEPDEEKEGMEADKNDTPIHDANNQEANQNVSKMASQIADMISDINEG